MWARDCGAKWVGSSVISYRLVGAIIRAGGVYAAQTRGHCLDEMGYKSADRRWAGEV
jgi:hypothetical protein